MSRTDSTQERYTNLLNRQNVNILFRNKWVFFCIAYCLFLATASGPAHDDQGPTIHGNGTEKK
jgi:hypothetical protein